MNQRTYGKADSPPCAPRAAAPCTLTSATAHARRQQRRSKDQRLRKSPMDRGRQRHAPERVFHRGRPQTQTSLFKAAVAKAFTTVVAGLAFTITSLPKISLLPALVAGFKRVLIRHTPGRTNFPACLTCAVATLARLPSTFDTSDLFSSVSSASACAKALFVIALPVGLPPFIAFMGAMSGSSKGAAEMEARIPRRRCLEPK